MREQEKRLACSTGKLYRRRRAAVDGESGDLPPEGAPGPRRQVCIAIVGKYNRGTDAYLSIVRALGHAAVHANRKLEYRWVDSEHLQDEATEQERAKAQEELDKCDGILVPGGFGDRGIEGKIRACRYARETLKPFLGICLGLQVRRMDRGAEGG